MYLKKDLMDCPKEERIETALEIKLDYTILSATDVLPSKGDFYPNKKIYIRGLRFKEQMEVTTITGNPDTDRALAFFQLKAIYENCIRIDGVEFGNILSDDFLVMGLFISYLTNPDQKTKPVVYKCVHCDKENSISIPLFSDKLSFKDYELNELTTVETSIGKLIIGPVDLNETEAFNAGQYGYDFQYALHIKKLNGKPLQIPQRVDAYGLLTTEDIGKLWVEINKLRSYVEPVKSVCEHCNKENLVSIELDLLKVSP